MDVKDHPAIAVLQEYTQNHLKEELLMKRRCSLILALGKHPREGRMQSPRV